MPRHRVSTRSQSGFTLIEGLVAILVFSLAVLALVGLQTTAVQQSSNAKMRANASLLASQILGQMWVSDRTPATLQTNFQTGGANYNAWLANVQASLPVPSTALPTVTVTNAGLVTVTVKWKAPNEPASDPPHQYVAVAQLNN
jgi:type IV pilus assembly protein PilV